MYIQGKVIRNDMGLYCLPKSSCVKCELCSKELWKQFNVIGTEMIITKAGRRMFPALKVKFFKLDPKKKYIVFMDILSIDNNRYKYVYHNSQWVAAGAADFPLPRVFYIHPDSPATGDVWMGRDISFEKVKLTNNHSAILNGQIPLHSMHRYVTRVHIMSTEDEHTPPNLQVNLKSSTSFSFSETSFITVTAYQNQKVTRLKIESNPFAKGFRENSRNRTIQQYDYAGNEAKTEVPNLDKREMEQLYRKREQSSSNYQAYIHRRIKLVIPPTYIHFRNDNPLDYTCSNEHYSFYNGFQL